MDIDAASTGKRSVNGKKQNQGRILLLKGRLCGVTHNENVFTPVAKLVKKELSSKMNRFLHKLSSGKLRRVIIVSDYYPLRWQEAHGHRTRNMLQTHSG